MIDQIVSHYRILKELGKGAMGVVYLADDLHLIRQVAIKFAHEKQDESRFHLEARLAASLDHKNIVRVYDYGKTEDGKQFIVMEFVDGQKLGEYLRHRELKLKRRLKIVSNIAEALGEAHRCGIIHRDIKPGNVMVNKQWEAKVMDFGLAKQTPPPLSVSSNSIDLFAQTLANEQTQAGQMLGTPYYMSPEQAGGEAKDAEPRSDLFSLGVVLYECLTDVRPFKGTTATAICGEMLHVHPPPPSQHNSEVTPELDRITLKALAKNLADRYQTADEFLDDLRAATEGLQASISTNTNSISVKEAPQVPVKNDPPKLVKTRSKWWSLIILLAIAVGYFGLARGVRWWPFQPNKYKSNPVAEKAYEKGDEALRDGNYYQASQLLKMAVEADGNYLLAHARLAEALTELDDENGAQKHLNEIHLAVKDFSALPETEALYLHAVLNVVSHKYPQAISDYQKLVNLASAKDKPAAHFNLGRAYEKNDDTDKSVEQFKIVIQLDPQSAAAHLRLGIIYGVRLKKVAEAEKWFDQAEKLYNGAGSVEGVTEVLFQRGTMYDGLNQLIKSREPLQLASEKSKVFTNQHQYVKGLLQLSLNSLYQRKFFQAQGEAMEAFKLAQSNKMNDLATKGLINLGMISGWQGKDEQAETYFNQALDLAYSYKGQYNIALAKSNCCNVYLQNNSHLDKCLKDLEDARSFFKSSGYLSEELPVLLLLGRAHRKKGNMNAAKQFYEEALSLSIKLNDKFMEAQTHSEIGHLLSAQAQYKEALEHFDRRYEISKLLDGKDEIVQALIYRAEMLYQLGNYAEANSVLAEANSIVPQLNGDHNETVSKILSLKAQIAAKLPKK